MLPGPSSGRQTAWRLRNDSQRHAASGCCVPLLITYPSVLPTNGSPSVGSGAVPTSNTGCGSPEPANSISGDHMPAR